jgi:hypothetical protein
LVEKIVVKAEFPSPAKIARQLHLLGVPAALSTVRRDLLSMDFSAYKRPMRPALTEADRLSRLMFCRRLLRNPRRFHESLIFSDEKWFDSNDHGDEYHWRRRGEETRCRERVQAPAKVLVWGAIGVGWRHLVVLDISEDDRGVTSESYRKKCLTSLRGVPELRGRRLQQDGAKVHWTAENRAYIHRVLKMPVLDKWPAHSPDLNPIENLWSIVQRKVSRRGPWAAEELREYVMSEWSAVPQCVVDKLVLSFRSRCEQCVERDGLHVW